VRHAGAKRIDVLLGDGAIVVRDDGAGIPGELRPGASGLRSMLNRAETIGADLELAPGPDGTGTTVRLRLPVPDGGASARDRPEGALA
jgi:signal transduction histidine kinase